MRVSHRLLVWLLSGGSIADLYLLVINGPASAAGDCDGRNAETKLTNIQHFRVILGDMTGAVQ